jgi:DNA-3-methyladenine glycosylase
MKLPRDFFDRPTLDVARDLLGKYLVRRRGRRRLVGRIVETEAYCGPEDRACHASRGRTNRTEVMFGPPGHAYVYLVYGLHHCLNVVTEREGYPAAVLLRALEPADGIPMPEMNGPGRLCRALGIDRRLNGLDLTGDLLYFEDRGEAPVVWQAAPRIGVDYAGAWARKPWRYFIDGSRAVSRGSPRRSR